MPTYPMGSGYCSHSRKSIFIVSTRVPLPPPPLPPPHGFLSHALLFLSFLFLQRMHMQNVKHMTWIILLWFAMNEPMLEYLQDTLQALFFDMETSHCFLSVSSKYLVESGRFGVSVQKKTSSHTRLHMHRIAHYVTDSLKLWTPFDV